MKIKKKRVGSFLCFGAPVTDENETPPPAKGSSEIKRIPKKKMKKLRIMSKIARSLSFNSNSSDRSEKLPKDRSRSLPRKVSHDKKSEAANFSSCLSASSSSSFAAADAKLGRRKTILPLPAPGNYGYATGLCLVLLSLFVVVFCGRLCAILWTATSLCLAPRRKPTVIADIAAAEVAVMRRKRSFREAEEKKRVVLEGFLQRNPKIAVKAKRV